jgi:hypothetical protein
LLEVIEALEGPVSLTGEARRKGIVTQATCERIVVETPGGEADTYNLAIARIALATNAEHFIFADCDIVPFVSDTEHDTTPFLEDAADVGYPASVQVQDGTIVTAYYCDRIPAHQRYHMGIARWRIDE